jgi:hypothetical protein
MTLRTIESEFTEELLKEMKSSAEGDLTLDGPLFERVHPKVILKTIQFRNDPAITPELPAIAGWHYDCFINTDEARKAYPGCDLIFEGRPWTVKKFLDMGSDTAIIEFRDYGTIYVSRRELNKEAEKNLPWHILPTLLCYALSPELWGPQGKWTRFHQKLMELFTLKNLLIGEAEVGYYPLRFEASKLRESGFNGTHLEKTYLLVLPWTFSLSALEKLENVIRQEF